jgi:ElaA protein
MKTQVALSKDLQSCFEVRRAVFIEEQNVTEAEEMDGLDEGCLHILARQNDVPVGTARIIIEGETAKIGRVCVLSQARGTGIGAEIMREAMKVCENQSGVRKLKLGSQIHAMGFYEKLGFRAFGPIYLDADIEHRDMELSL